METCNKEVWKYVKDFTATGLTLVVFLFTIASHLNKQGDSL